ncbi:hypothetical protein FDI24_gp176 [Acidovorax phage ACP17]|uniref:ParB/Sulfiredoxin domain-containing protein n=1 Tax=Acidovorax phage ACP17 TaxID=2010329 RepID=A0A218M349_9CAUD|nr:hypothetical protein FDI24_gp176 [Acidovorax phage ACP17]ASD50458.1 hypothetical protein [Acidovorax phage ACP17]
MHIPNEDNGMGKRRHAMPQIKDFDAFMKDLEANDIAVVTISVDPEELKPTQGNFNEAKVKAMLADKSWSKNPIVSSDDDFVLDGHHRWLAAANAKQFIKSRVVDLPIDELLDFVKGKPYVETKALHEDMRDNLSRIQDYYARIGRGEGGESLVKMLTQVNSVREAVQSNHPDVKKNRAVIMRKLQEVMSLCGVPA